MIFNHILSQMGVLKTFSVAKKVSEEDMKIMASGFLKSGGKRKDLTDYLKNEIVKKTQEDFMKNQVPGLILNEQALESIAHSKMIELTQFSAIVAEKIMEKRLDKFYSCFIVNALMNMLGITDDDFEEFYKKFSKLRGESEDE